MKCFLITSRLSNSKNLFHLKELISIQPIRLIFLIKKKKEYLRTYLICKIYKPIYFKISKIFSSIWIVYLSPQSFKNILRNQKISILIKKIKFRLISINSMINLYLNLSKKNTKKPQMRYFCMITQFFSFNLLIYLNSILIGILPHLSTRFIFHFRIKINLKML